MPREVSIRYTALNVRTHPHSYDGYISLLTDAFKLRKPITLSSDRFALLTKCSFDPTLELILGELTTFLGIDPDGWYNTAEFRAAQKHEKSAISIPESMAANHKSFNFIFNPKTHYLIIETNYKKNNISPSVILKFFKSIFSLSAISNKYEDINLTLVPSKDILSEILSTHSIKTLEIVIERPNPDIFDPDLELEEETLQRLDAENLNKEIIIKRAAKGQSLNPSSETINLCRVAQVNGLVEVTGKDINGKRVVGSTADSPFIFSSSFRPDLILPTQHLVNIFDRIQESVRSLLSSRS